MVLFLALLSDLVVVRLLRVVVAGSVVVRSSMVVERGVVGWSVLMVPAPVCVGLLVPVPIWVGSMVPVPVCVGLLVPVPICVGLEVVGVRWSIVPGLVGAVGGTVDWFIVPLRCGVEGDTWALATTVVVRSIAAKNRVFFMIDESENERLKRQITYAPFTVVYGQAGATTHLNEIIYRSKF